ncbi:MAG TPA: tRNA lysidine(34) synthetase TilS [Gemmatimonadales bacterium]|nr:tRNA lysidine(34) synthetase TilS [Gemmatimonadales bacterium]
MGDLPGRFAKHLAGLNLEPGPVVVAVSGGPDSLALLHLMREVASSFELIVAHVDHGIHPESAKVAAEVGRAAAHLNLSFEMVSLALGPDASETRAREARYRWLRDLARKRKAWLFTAHHRDDQVETVLMRVLKGSGPAGLAGIATVSGRLVRPLLPFGRDEIRAWLSSLGVSGWDDPANQDPKHLRSWLRNQLIPAAREHVAALDQRLLGLAGQAATDRLAWDAVVELLGIEVEREGEGFRFDARSLRGKPDALISTVFQAVARRHGLVFGARSAGRVTRMIELHHSGRSVDLTDGWEARFDFGRVSVRMAPFTEPAEPSALTIRGESGADEWDGWQVTWSPGVPAERQERVTSVAWLEPSTYTIRAWRPGDRIRPLGGVGSRLVVRCMQDVRLARAERSGWPVVERDRELIWVPQVCRSTEAIPRGSGLRLVFEKRHS